jgi:hypothetical protein
LPKIEPIVKLNMANAIMKLATLDSMASLANGGVDGLLDALMRIDWGIVNLHYIDTLLSEHGVSFDDLTPLLEHHCDKLAHAVIQGSRIKFDELTQYGINVPNASLRALIFIIFKYEKQMYEVPTINDLYIRLLNSDGRDEKWLMAIFDRLNKLIAERFILSFETKSLSEIVSYASLHKLTETRAHLVAAIKNPDACVFKHFLEKLKLRSSVCIDCNDRFNERVDIEYVVKHAPFETFLCFTRGQLHIEFFEGKCYREGHCDNAFYEAQLISPIKLAFDHGKCDIGNALVMAEIYFLKSRSNVKSVINTKTPITRSNWMDLCRETSKSYLYDANIMSACCHNNIAGIGCILALVKPSVELVRMLYLDTYSQSYTVSEDVYNNNKVLLYKEILGNSQYKIIFDALHIPILRDSRNEVLIKTVFHRIGIDFMKLYDAKLLGIGNVGAYSFVKKVIYKHNYTKDDFDINKMLTSLKTYGELAEIVKELSITKADFNVDKILEKVFQHEKVSEFIKTLGIKKHDFDPLVLFNGFSSITKKCDVKTFMDLIKHLEIDKFDFEKMQGKCSQEFVAIVKSLFNLDASVCAKLSGRRC